MHTYLVCDIIHNDDSICPSVVAGCDGPEPLLTCSVPLEKKEEKKGAR